MSNPTKEVASFLTVKPTLRNNVPLIKCLANISKSDILQSILKKFMK